MPCHPDVADAAPLAVLAAPPPVPSPTRIDAEAQRLMQAAHARGMALAVIDGGKVVHVAAYGERNAAGEPLRTDTVMYAASLTKMAFGHLVAQLAQDARIDLDASIATAWTNRCRTIHRNRRSTPTTVCWPEMPAGASSPHACCSTIPVALPTSAFWSPMGA